MKISFVVRIKLSVEHLLVPSLSFTLVVVLLISSLQQPIRVCSVSVPGLSTLLPSTTMVLLLLAGEVALMVLTRPITPLDWVFLPPKVTLLTN